MSSRLKRCNGRKPYPDPFKILPPSCISGYEWYRWIRVCVVALKGRSARTGTQKAVVVNRRRREERPGLVLNFSQLKDSEFTLKRAVPNDAASYKANLGT